MAWSANFKIVWYVLLRPRRPELILVKSAHFIRSNTGNTGKILPVLKSPEYRKTGFGIAGIGNTNMHM
jgi:hypothetical protein